jgi:type IV pilus assembly protein PilY1
MKKSIFFTLFVLTTLVSICLIQSHADDTELFISQVPPDALILLDMSGSMNYSPAGPPYVSPPNRRIDIAREVLKDLLDDDDDGKIDSKDEKSLNIRLGYMRYWDSYSNDDNEPTTGSIKVLSNIGSSYKDIWDKISTPGETNPVGGTPLAASLAEAKTYFTRDVNPVDPAIKCRQKFVILITDGADTWACSGNGADPNCGVESSNPGMSRRRMLTVQRAKELYEAGIKVFVVGFGGGMPECLKRTLNWAAKNGGTDNPLEIDSGNPGAYDVTKYGDACTTTDTNADPANYPLSGYAFLAEDASQLSKALKAIAKYIQELSYSFTAPTIPSVRLIDKDVVYISSFTPNETPFWKGNFKAYRLNEDGTLPVDGDGKPLNANLLWDGFEILKDISPDSRKIYTYASGALKSFIYDNLTNADLDVLSDLDRQNLINHIRGGVDVYDVDGDGDITEMRGWKLGDIFHSNVVIVGSPSQFFKDIGFNEPGGFYETNKNRTKVIIAGANDGMLHAFNAATGVEEWAFIPNSILKNLKSMISAHTYYVDSSPKVADVWFYSNVTDNTKSADEWKTVLVNGLRGGGKQYFALDITDTLSPKYLWEFPKPTDSVTLAKVGQSWSEPAIGRVNIEIGGKLYERWVAFIGGGFDSISNTGRALFVIDIKTGEIIWEFSYEDKGGEKNYMTHSLAAPPTAVDINLDGYIDKIYIGDLGGQMWVFDVSKPDTIQWTGKRLFKAPVAGSEKHSIYYQPSVAFDRDKNLWVYFGTGDRENPKDTSNPAERFYGIRDDGIEPYPREEENLSDVTSLNTFNQDPLKKGWYIKLEKTGQRLEKVLAKPTIFNRLLYFTTYTYTETADPCSVAGVAKLYVVEYLSGGGALNVDDMSDILNPPSDFVYKRSQEIGSGAPSAPVITVNMKGKGSVIIGTTSGQIYSEPRFSIPTNKEILYWQEVIP